MNDDPEAYWNEIAGPRWVRAQELLDVMLEPPTDALLRAIDVQRAERVIDVGGGCGALTMAIGERTGPEGMVLSVDLSRPMIDRARERSGAPPHLRFVHGDAARHPYQSESFDLITSRFGVMFFPEPVDAFRHLRGALKPAGRMHFASWARPDLNPWVSWALGAFPGLEPEGMPAPDEGPGPFSLSNPGTVQSILTEAGFGSLSIEAVTTHMAPGRTVDEAMAIMTEVGMLARVLADAPADDVPSLLQQARAFVESEYAEGPPHLDAAVLLVRAEP